VELERDLTSCPLCSTPVYFPEDMAEGAQKRYPERVQKTQPKHVNLVPSKAFVYLMTFILIIPIIVCLDDRYSRQQHHHMVVLPLPHPFC
jgi:hypothetical protein